jgi:hypothetical protein
VFRGQATGQVTLEYLERVIAMEMKTETPENVLAEDAQDKSEEMCCDDSGRTAEQHRHESADGKCCVDG